MTIWIILIFFMVVGFLVQQQLKSKFKKYSKQMLSSGLSGKEVAEQMLSSYGINDVKILSVQGRLTDHYNPANKTVNLSPDVYNGRHVAAAAVAAHECGHAVQHATAYKWLSMRSTLVPAVNMSNKIINIVFIAGMLGAFAINIFPIDLVLKVVIALQAIITAFTLITLPVEYDASNRALHWLEGARVTVGEETQQATTALKWAARTYLVAALAAVTQLAYYVMLMMAGDD